MKQLEAKKAEVDKELGELKLEHSEALGNISLNLEEELEAREEVEGKLAELRKQVGTRLGMKRSLTFLTLKS